MDAADSDSTCVEMEYYRDVLQCFVPSCKKYRRDFPNSVYLSIPKSLQATWCLALSINCPKRNLYVCGDHINIEEDCYQSKSGKLHLKKTANLVLTKTIDEDMLTDESNIIRNALTEDNSKDLPTTSSTSTQSLHHGNMPYSKCDASTQTEIGFSTKAVLVKPSVRSVGCQANITEKVMPSQPSSSTASRSPTPSLYQPSSPSTSSTAMETIAERRDMSGRTHTGCLVHRLPKKNGRLLGSFSITLRPLKKSWAHV